jgi:hypothetical protein
MRKTKIKLVHLDHNFYYRLSVPVQIKSAIPFGNLTRKERELLLADEPWQTVTFFLPRLDAEAVSYVAKKTIRERLKTANPEHFDIIPKVHPRHLYADALIEWMKVYKKVDCIYAVRLVRAEFRATDINLHQLVKACEDGASSRLDPVEIIRELAHPDAAPRPAARIRMQLHRQYCKTKYQINRSMWYYRKNSPVIKALQPLILR